VSTKNFVTEVQVKIRSEWADRVSIKTLCHSPARTVLSSLHITHIMWSVA